MATGDDFLRDFYIDSAIEAFTFVIDNASPKLNPYPPPPPPPPPPPDYNYLGRGIARCFNPLKPGEKYADAITDLSAALAFDDRNVEALYYRAYAYYMSKLYDCAIADCENIKTILNNPKDIANIPVYELLGRIYDAKKQYIEAAKNYRKAIQLLLELKIKGMRILPPSLFDNYRKVCEKMQDAD